MTKQEQKELFKLVQKKEGCKRLDMIGVLPNVIHDLLIDNQVYYSERETSLFNGVLYYLDNRPDFVEKVKEFEEKNNAFVYHAILTHNSEIGDMLALLYVSERKEEWDDDNADLAGDEKTPYSYVINLDCPDLSEIGTIQIKPSMGGVSRIY